MDYQYIKDEKTGCAFVQCIQSTTTTNTYSSCPSEDNLYQVIAKCKESGYGYYTYYDVNQCKQIECTKQESTSTQPTPTTPSVVCPSEEELDSIVEKCKEAGNSDIFYYYDSDQCKRVGCKSFLASDLQIYVSPTTTTSTCPSEDLLYKDIAKCKEGKLDYYFYYDQFQCKQVACKFLVTSTCTQSSDLESQAVKCKEYGFDYSYSQDANGCTIVSCIETQKLCPDTPALENEIAVCEKKGMSYDTYPDENNCKKIKCIEKTSITSCQKSVDDSGCVSIWCDDGYYCNSCNSQEVCRVECKEYTDEKGCTVKACTDGYQQTTCPVQPTVECKAYTDEKGCEVKTCTDGAFSTYCPAATVDCKTYEEGGCTIKECTDGYKAKYCAETSTTVPTEIECKVYTDENSCEVKVCTNGYEYNSCDTPTTCSTETVDGCTIKTCTDGYTAKECPESTETESVECKEYTDEGGCTVKICTDGYNDKVCPTSSACSEKAFENLLNWLKSFFE